jgi:hypothetical protein
MGLYQAMNWADPNFDRPPPKIPSSGVWRRLTPAEDKRILELRADGMSYNHIALRLNRSPQTVAGRYRKLVRERSIPAHRPSAIQTFRSLMTEEVRGRQLTLMAIECGLELVPLATLRKFSDLIRADAIAEVLAEGIK